MLQRYTLGHGLYQRACQSNRTNGRPVAAIELELSSMGNSILFRWHFSVATTELPCTMITMTAGMSRRWEISRLIWLFHYGLVVLCSIGQLQANLVALSYRNLHSPNTRSGVFPRPTSQQNGDYVKVYWLWSREQCCTTRESINIHVNKPRFKFKDKTRGYCNTFPVQYLHNESSPPPNTRGCYDQDIRRLYTLLKDTLDPYKKSCLLLRFNIVQVHS